MATDTKLLKRSMMEMYSQKASPTMFLSGWFRTKPAWMFRSTKIVMDVKRNDEQYAVDVTRYGGGVFNTNKRFSTKEYMPPMFNEYTAYTAQELEDRLPGMTEYDERGYTAQLLALITDDQALLRDKIQRAREKMASDVLFTGKITLLNSDEVDFKQKATHNFSAATAWSNSSADYRVDFAKAAKLCRTDGKVTVDTFNVIMSETSFVEWLKLVEVGDRNQGVKIEEIGFQERNTEGASFHGRVDAGSYTFNIWTYPQYLTIPTGWGLSGEGTDVPYIPDEKIVVIPAPERIDLRTVYAGIPTIAPARSNQIASALGLSGVPTTERAETMPYYKLDEEDEQLKSGVKSSFMTIPSQIDGWAVIST